MQPLLDETMGHFIKTQSKTYASAPALWFRSHTWSYQELDEYSDKLACGLLASGVGKGSHVAIWAESTPEKIFFFYALQKLGAVAVMINRCLNAEEAEALAQLADVDFLAMGPGQTAEHTGPEVWPYRARRPLKGIFLLDAGQDHSSSGFPTIKDLSAAGRGRKDALSALQKELSPSDPALILFTSGTTGSHGKAVLSSSFNLVNGGLQKADSMEATQEDVFCCALPLCHVFGIDVNLLAALSSGACLALPEDNHSYNILRTLQEADCTLFSAVPSIFKALMARKDFSSFRFPRLRSGIVGGAYCSPSDFRAIEAAFSFTLLPGLGQTETTAGIAIAGLQDSLEVRSTTVGHFVPHMEGQILDPKTGTEMPLGELGEVCVRGPLLMMGYYNAPGCSPLDTHGWLHTGDLGFLDQNRNLHLKGRIKELINRGGEKILPQELENLLLTMPGIVQCKVIGLPDPHYGEVVCACVQTASSPAHITGEDIIAFLRPHIAHFKLPQYVLFLNKFPATETGKIHLSALKNFVMERLGMTGAV